MRITNSIMTKSYLNNLSKNLSSLAKLQEKGSTGKQVNRLSDDPITGNKIMNLRNNILENENYNKTIEQVLSWNNVQDTALQDATKSIRHIRDLTIRAAKSQSQEERDAISGEVEQEVKALKDIFNTNYDGRYVFGNQRTKTPPFEFDGDGILRYTANQNGDNNNKIKREVGQGIEIELMTDGARLNGKKDELGVFLNDLVKDIKNGEIDDLSNESIGKLDEHFDRLLGINTEIGAIDNRAESLKERNLTENISLKTMLSSKEDVDIVENYIESTLMSNVYQASLSIGAKILQPSLLDYLR